MAVGRGVVVLGVPSGVKVFSGVFGASPEGAAVLARLFLRGLAGLGVGEVLDIDEEAYRRGQLRIKLHGHLLVPKNKNHLQPTKHPSSIRAGMFKAGGIRQFLFNNCPRE